MQAEEHKMEEAERGAALYTVFNLYTATYLYSKVTEIRGGGGRGEERVGGTKVTAHSIFPSSQTTLPFDLPLPLRRW